jgi:hypothetical protein
MDRALFYRSAVAAGIVGGGWLIASGTGLVAFTPCLVKHVTGMPCPTCGATRAALAFIQGDVGAAFLLNPIGPLMVIVTAGTLAFVLRDLVLQRHAVHRAYLRLCELLRQPQYAVPLAMLMCVNWAWNVYKGL